jgi:hypothetical protein
MALKTFRPFKFACRIRIATEARGPYGPKPPALIAGHDGLFATWLVILAVMDG